MSEMLSQEEIDALLRGDTSSSYNEQLLSSEEIDALGEIGNISMGTSATTLFTLLNNKVTITTPKVTITTWNELAREYPMPYVAVEVKYTEGLEGTNLLILKEEDVKIITDLMMGGDGSNTSAEINELHLSAISEAMNQMIGSASTSLATMFNKSINISPPKAFLMFFEGYHADQFDLNEQVVKVAFKMVIGNLIDSEIMQLIPVEFAKKLVENLLKPTGSYSEELPKENKPQKQDIKPADHKLSNEVKSNIKRNSQDAYPKEEKKFVNVQPVQYQSFDYEHAECERENIDLIMDVPLEITVELGRTKKLIKDILEFGPGTVLELDRLAGEPVDILVNGKFVAKGEVVVIDENFGVRITDIISPSKRLSKIQ